MKISNYPPLSNKELIQNMCRGGKFGIFIFLKKIQFKSNRDEKSDMLTLKVLLKLRIYTTINPYFLVPPRET